MQAMNVENITRRVANPWLYLAAVILYSAYNDLLSIDQVGDIKQKVKEAKVIANGHYTNQPSINKIKHHESAVRFFEIGTYKIYADVIGKEHEEVYAAYRRLVS